MSRLIRGFGLLQAAALNPSNMVAVAGVGALNLFLLYRKIHSLGKITVTLGPAR